MLTEKSEEVLAQDRHSIARERYLLLAELLTIEEAIKRSFSRNENNVSPKLGYEAAYGAAERKLEVLREMLIEERTRMEEAQQDLFRIMKV